MFRRIILTLAISVTDHFDAFPGRWRVLRWILHQSAELERLPAKLLALDGGTNLLLEAHNNAGHYAETDSLRKDLRVVRVFQSLLAPGDAVLDIGSNIGRMAVLASRLVGPNGQVAAFEPSPKVITSLFRNVALNGCGNVTIHPVAVSDECATLPFFIPIGSESACSSLRKNVAEQCIKMDVPSITIDELCRSQKTLKLIKIDVEGADLRVVRGAGETIARLKPVIVLEFSPDWIRQLGDDPAWLAGFFAEAGYRLYRLADEGPRHLDALPNHQIDLLCTPVPLSSESWDALRLLSHTVPKP